jgi:acyl carrier protein
MDRAQVQTRVITMMADTFELEAGSISADSKLYEDLELDSIDALDLVVKLQEIIQHRVEEAELREIKTVNDVVELVLKHLPASAE